MKFPWEEDAAPAASWRPQLTHQEKVRGWVFFALYVLVLPRLLGWLQYTLVEQWPFLDVQTGLVYNLAMVVLTVAVFWSFLRHAVDILLDHLPQNAFALVTGLVGAGALHLLVSVIPLPADDPFASLYSYEMEVSPLGTVVVLCLLMPVVEEVLYRGLMFGSLRKKSRPLAYCVTVLVYALAQVWVYAFLPDATDLRYILLFVRYLPMSLALTWCYDNGGSIFTPMVLHGVINLIRLLTL